MSAISDVFSVGSAVEHLQELENRMKTDEFGFSAGDVSSIDRIVEALQELECERAKQHELLEAETIQASIIRRRLQHFPSKIKQEIQAAVDSARQSNAEELKGLQDKLKAINENIEFLKQRQEDLEKENAVLHPERDKVRRKHEEIIQQLNQRMAEKATKQIILNETRDKVRETNQKIVDLEEGIVQLKEDLIQERTEAREEKKRLKKAVYDTTVKTREQKEINVEKKKEVDGLHERLMDTEGKLAEIRKSIRRYDASRVKLESQEKTLSTTLDRQLKVNHSLRQEGLKLNNSITQEQEGWRVKKAEMETRLKDTIEDIGKQKNRNGELEIRKMDLEIDVTDKVKIRRSDAERVKESNSVLQAAKELLARSAEEVGRLRQENVDMEVRIDQLGETHEAIVNTLKTQIEECREQLGKERKERLDLQKQRDDVQKEIEDYKAENNKFLNDMSKKINDGKQKHDNLTKEGTQLQKDLRNWDAEIKDLQVKAAAAESNYSSLKEKLEREVSHLERDIANTEKTIEDRKKTIEEDTPGFQEMEQNYEDTTGSYDKMKKGIVGMKNKKQSLDDSCKRIKKDIEKMEDPKNKMLIDLKKKRAESLNQLKKNAEDVKAVESEIYTCGCKLRTANQENQLFEEAIEKLQEEIGQLRDRLDHNEDESKFLEGEFSQLRGVLEEDWVEDSHLTKKFAERDQEIVEGLTTLLMQTEEREKKISGVTDRLQEELSLLAVFLDNVAKRRPTESRSAPRKPKDAWTTENSIDKVADANRLGHPQPPAKVIPRSQQPKARVKVTPRVKDTAASPRVPTITVQAESRPQSKNAKPKLLPVPSPRSARSSATQS